ncbi:MAG: MazG nucleotide pyrophosphohydrolase domain-containing protein [Candidatus Margulisiibacteriota bacterium]|nr:hypothetical protein [Candidatus Margulisiibacteriota bacterium]
MKEFDKLVEVVHILRKECPWDKEQTLQSLKPYLLEETQEAIEAIEEEDDELLAEELGDKLLHVVMLAEMLKERKTGDIKKVVLGITKKMIRRHPHVFGKNKLKTAGQVLKQWGQIKKKEKARKREKGRKR